MPGILCRQFHNSAACLSGGSKAESKTNPKNNILKMGGANARVKSAAVNPFSDSADTAVI